MQNIGNVLQPLAVLDSRCSILSKICKKKLRKWIGSIGNFNLLAYTRSIYLLLLILFKFLMSPYEQNWKDILIS